MSQPTYIELHTHTAYSLLEGAIRHEKLISLLKENKIPAVAMADSGNIFGAMAFSKACSGGGIQPIIGCQLKIKTPEKKFGLSEDMANYDTVVVLVQNEEGYKNLLLHFTPYYMGQNKQIIPHLTLEELCQHTEGLLLLTGGPTGILARPLLNNKPKEAEEILITLSDAFPNRLYIELQRHHLPQEEAIEDSLLDLAYTHNIPLVATNEPYFLTPDMYEAHDALICIAEKTFVDEQDRRRLTPEHYFKLPDQMVALFADLPEATANTVQIAKRCSFMTHNKKPAFPIFDCGTYTKEQLLEKNAHEGLKWRMKNRSQEDYQHYKERLEYEISIINQMGFPGYFLIVADFICWSKEHGVPVGPGRGSGAGSVVAWALRITDIDPLRFNLLFERFLNPERVSMPDFDVDFCQTNRYRTIEYVQQKYGFDHVAQIITFGKLQAKAVIRDVGRVLQIPYPVVDRLSKLIPDTLGITLKEAMAQEPALENEAKNDESIARLLEIAIQLEGLYRNSSTHAAGVVIGDKPLDQIVPIYKDPSSDMPVTQYNMKFVEQASLIKFDFLGLKTLTVIAETVRLIKKRGIDFDISTISLEDKDTFDLLKAANTTGVFQLESSGMKKVLRDMQPDIIEDIVALVSLFRPGPMNSIPSYIARKKGLEQPDYMHPCLEPILKETYGIMIYQEQVMQISQVMAGYTLGGADLLRRAMGKKIHEEMERQRGIFIEGALKKGIPQKTAETVFDKMAKFAEYGFNKSHAAAYAFITYQTAYLKAHFPVEFMAATMTFDKNNTDKLAFFKNDFHQNGFEVLPPDINKSDVNFSVENGAIRYALSAVKNVGEAGMALIVAEREKNGPFQSIQDFLNRTDVTALNKRYIEHLVKAGAFDCLHTNRAELYANVERMIAFAGNATAERNSTQISLFGSDSTVNHFKLLSTSPWSYLERLSHEAEALGFYLSAHPLDAYRAVFDRMRVLPSDQITSTVQSSGTLCVKLGGIVSSVRERFSQKGNKFAFITATDKAGQYDMICFSDALSTYREMLKSDKPLLITAIADIKEGEEQARLNFQRAQYLEDVMAQTPSTLIVQVENERAIPALQQVLTKKGASPVYILYTQGQQQTEIKLPVCYTLPPDVLETLSATTGITDVRLV